MTETTVADLGTYLNIRTRLVVNAVDAPVVARTIEIPGKDLLVDVDADGHVLGIESLTGAIDAAELIDVLQAVRITGTEPSR